MSWSMSACCFLISSFWLQTSSLSQDAKCIFIFYSSKVSPSAEKKQIVFYYSYSQVISVQSLSERRREQFYWQSNFYKVRQVSTSLFVFFFLSLSPIFLFRVKSQLCEETKMETGMKFNKNLLFIFNLLFAVSNRFFSLSRFETPLCLVSYYQMLTWRYTHCCNVFRALHYL